MEENFIETATYTDSSSSFIDDLAIYSPLSIT